MTDEFGDGVENVLQPATSFSMTTFVVWQKISLRRRHRSLHTVQATGTLKAARYLDETFRNISFIEELQCVIDVIPVLSTKSIIRKMNGEQPLVGSYTLDIIDMISFKGALRHTALCRHYHTIFFLANPGRREF